MSQPQNPGDSFNPFASPKVEGPTAAIAADPQGYVIEGDLIVGQNKIVLPHICVKCGEQQPADGEIKRRKKDLYYVHPLLYVLAPFQLLIFLIIYMIIRKKCQVEYSLCRECLWKTQVNWIYFAVALAVLFGSVFGMIQFDSPWPLLGFLPGLIAMIVFAGWANGPIQISKYKDRKFYLKGAKAEALEIIAPETAYQSPYTAILAEDGRMG
ncbi:hypothetical protein GC197_03955 [bacterium]|nr:hypothetical protein [bacterium]